MIAVSFVMVAAMVAVDLTAARPTEIDVAGVLETLGRKIGMIQGITVRPTTNAKAVSASYQITNVPNRKVEVKPAVLARSVRTRATML